MNVGRNKASTASWQFSLDGRSRLRLGPGSSSVHDTLKSSLVDVVVRHVLLTTPQCITCIKYVKYIKCIKLYSDHTYSDRRNGSNDDWALKNFGLLLLFIAHCVNVQ